MENKEKDAMSDDYRIVAEKVQERVNKELPILEDSLSCLNKDDITSIQSLSLVVHNIAVIAPNMVCEFLQPICDLYSNFIECGKPELMNHSVWKSIKKTYKVYDSLNKKEKNAVEVQLLVAKQRFDKKVSDIIAHNSNVDDKERISIPIFDAREEYKFFQHVECDPSSSIRMFVFLMIAGYQPNDLQVKCLKTMISVAKSILNNEIERAKHTLKTTKELLSD